MIAFPGVFSGVVYRIKENSLIVAVEEAPEEGLDQPLRLEKLANEVRLVATCSSLLVLYTQKDDWLTPTFSTPLAAARVPARCVRTGCTKDVLQVVLVAVQD